MIFYLIAIVVVVVDQISKYLIRSYVNLNESFSWWGVQLTHYENSGMAGSMFQGYSRLFGVIAVLFIMGVLYYRKTGGVKGWAIDISFGCLVGGAAGNGIDRLVFGHVTDFLVSRSGHGVLNMADHAIEVGILIFLVIVVGGLFKNWRLKRGNSSNFFV
jgi:signal peptidase II